MKVKVLRKCKNCTSKDVIQSQEKEIESLKLTLEEADHVVTRYKSRIIDLETELIEANNKVHQLEAAVKCQSACWMCTENKICHQGVALPQSPSESCGRFKFGYKTSAKHSKTVCEYKHGRHCWAQKNAPECDEVFCPLNNMI